MEKPFVVCHMFTSVNGKIDGEFMSCPTGVPARTKYGNLREFYNCEAILYGAVTMAGGFSDGLVDAAKLQAISLWIMPLRLGRSSRLLSSCPPTIIVLVCEPSALFSLWATEAILLTDFGYCDWDFHL